MTFAAPAHFLWLLCILLFLWLAMQARAGAAHTVSSVLLMRALAEREGTGATRRRRRGWLLLLQIACLLLFTVLLAQPSWRTQTRGEHVHILLDASARTQAGNVFEHERTQARKWIGELAPNSTVTLSHTLHDGVWAHTPPLDRDEALRALDKVTPNFFSFNLEAHAGNARRNADRTVLVCPQWNGPADTGMTIAQVGNPSLRNTGIVALDLQQRDAALHGFVAVRNYDETSRAIPLEYRRNDGEWTQLAELALSPRQRAGHAFVLPADNAPAIAVRIRIDDDFPWDNTVEAAAQSAPAVLLCGRPNAALQRALSLIPGVRLDYREQPPAAYDGCALVIFNEVEFPPALETPTVVIAPSPQWNSLTYTDAASPEPLQWTGPAAWSDLALDTMRIRKARLLAAEAAWRPWLRTESGALIAQRERQLLFAFSLDESDWITRYSFPVFWQRWIKEHIAAREAYTVKRIDRGGSAGSQPGVDGMNLLSERAGDIAGGNQTLQPMKSGRAAVAAAHQPLRWPFEALLLPLLCAWWLAQRR